MMRHAVTTDELARKGLTPVAWPHDGGMLRMLVIALLVVVLAPARAEIPRKIADIIRAEAGRVGLDPVPKS
jgi:hypothetical protein